MKIITWLESRLRVITFLRDTVTRFYLPKNFNVWYVLGSLALVVFINQIITGIWLTMSYHPTAEGAFASIEHIMRDVKFGWLLRYMHSTGASAFFIIIYLHMFRSLLYASYQRPRELVWLIGMGLYLLLMAEAFMGYLLPWGQMSYWGAQVITSLFSAIPWVGNTLMEWVRGDYVISGITLNRFFAFHVIAIPLFLIFLIVIHIAGLHIVGSNNPDGINIYKYKDDKGIPLDGIPFHPYYTIKDFVGVLVFLIAFSIVIFFMPTLGGYFLEAENFSPANFLKTPPHIAPMWYLAPYYAMLRAIPNKFFGVIILAAAIAILFALPWLDKCKVKSIRYRGRGYTIILALFVLSFIGLGYLGLQPVDPTRTNLARILTLIYFLFFLLMPYYTRRLKTKHVPDRVP